MAFRLPRRYLLKKGGHAPPFASRSEFARLIPRGRALCALRSAFNLPRLIEMIPRADPVARGGDLDILVLTSSPGFEISHLVGTCFFARCEEKIDVVVLDPGNLTAEQAGFLARLTRIRLK